jgi:RNA polymerase sigma factor
LRYAGLVINRRIIDWLRQQRRHRQVLTFSQCAAEQGEDFTEHLVGLTGDQIRENLEIEEELVLLRQRLLDFNLTLASLVRRFPRHRDARLTCIRISRLLLAEPALRGRFEQERRLPAADLARYSHIPLKSIERNRQSIIFLALLLDSGLDVIKAYLTMYSKEETL